MQASETKNKLAIIYTLIEKRQLKDAINYVKELADISQNWMIIEKITELETNYRYMIHYFVEGHKDPEQNRIYSQLLRDLYTLADDAAEKVLKENSSSLFYEKSRLQNVRASFTLDHYREALIEQAETFSFLDLLEEGSDKQTRTQQNIRAHENTITDLFYAVFSDSRANDDRIDSYKKLMDDSLIHFHDKSMILSALTLNILQRFDAKKIGFLLDMCYSKAADLAMRAIVGLLPVFQTYISRWSLYPECTDRLKLLSDHPDFSRRLMTAIIQFIQAHETEKITKKLTEEIIPEMMKLSPMIGKKINLDEWISDTGFEDKNPEWQKIFDDAGLTDKLQEFSEMQLEGADVFHSTFANLKSYPFFHEMSNWFLPFDSRHSQLQSLFTNETEGKALIETLIDSSLICNSDKYSFCFSVMIMPDQYRKMMIAQLGAEGDELKNLQEEEQALQPYQKEETICKQYIQDLYRFFKLYPRRNEYADIFDLPLNYHEIEAFHPIVMIPKNLRRIALYYFEKNNFNEALSTYTMLSQTTKPDSEVWQKIGYCRQMLGDIQQAIDAYLHAELIDESNTWLMRRIGQCYRILKQPRLALEYYRRLEQLLPDDLNVQLNIGHCYLESKNYEEALNYYFKVELLDSSNRRAWRSIAWCAFLSRKFDIAQKYYAQILENKPNSHDFLNAGHVELCLNNPKRAVELYERSLQSTGQFDVFRSMLYEDEDELREAGVDTQILPIILDKIIYDAQ
ncbi:MAG TPA: hypothetical protein DDZ96_03015 [Porphyromonadaceae bacterium]|jgi:tetratricopeptide (TPR) repeat protein|nr:hypothetical protein [Porphyromonadaceae bacterium]HBX19459.1 hypothetical protein [Porphyromonadaceae bacterium]